MNVNENIIRNDPRLNAMRLNRERKAELQRLRDNARSVVEYAKRIHAARTSQLRSK